MMFDVCFVVPEFMEYVVHIFSLYLNLYKINIAYGVQLYFAQRTGYYYRKTTNNASQVTRSTT